VKVKIKAECGFINDRVPTMFHRKPIYVCLLVERSDGHLVDFRRIRYYQCKAFHVCVLTMRSAMKLNSGQDILLTAELLKHDQYITCYIMCDEIGKFLLRNL
jgi:ATP-dependent DNA helicase HFM1/MER3